MHRTMIEEVVPRSETQAPYAKIKFLAKNGKLIRTWVPLIGFVQEKARTIMPNDYSRAVGDYAELTIRTEVVEHLQRNMARYTDGSEEWPADFTEWFDFSLARSHTHEDEVEEPYSSDTDDDDDGREALVTD